MHTGKMVAPNHFIAHYGTNSPKLRNTVLNEDKEICYILTIQESQQGPEKKRILDPFLDSKIQKSLGIGQSTLYGLRHFGNS